MSMKRIVTCSCDFAMPYILDRPPLILGRESSPRCWSTCLRASMRGRTSDATLPCTLKTINQIRHELTIREFWPKSYSKARVSCPPLDSAPRKDVGEHGELRLGDVSESGLHQSPHSHISLHDQDSHPAHSTIKHDINLSCF